MSSLPTPYRLETIISHPRPLLVGLGGTLNSLVDPVINSPCQGPSSPSQAPQGTPVGPDTATFKRFESQFRHLCAILGKSLWPAVSAGTSGQPIMKLAHRCWRGPRGLPSSVGKYWFPPLPGLPSRRHLPWCAPCGTPHPGVSPSPERPKSPPFIAGCPQHPHPLPELAQGNGVFSPPSLPGSVGSRGSDGLSDSSQASWR